NSLHGDDFLAFSRAEYHNALGGAGGYADTCDRHADHLAAIGHQHDLILMRDRESGDEASDLVRLGDVRGADALAAPPDDAEIIGRRALAITVLAYGQHELLSRLQLFITLGRKGGLLADIL